MAPQPTPTVAPTPANALPPELLAKPTPPPKTGARKWLMITAGIVLIILLVTLGFVAYRQFAGSQALPTVAPVATTIEPQASIVPTTNPNLLLQTSPTPSPVPSLSAGNSDADIQSDLNTTTFDQNDSADFQSLNQDAQQLN